MAEVWIPTQLRALTGGAARVYVAGDTLGKVIDALETAHPGVGAQLREGDHIRTGLAISVDGDVTQMELLQPVGEKSEIHILPAIGGGCGAGVPESGGPSAGAYRRGRAAGSRTA